MIGGHEDDECNKGARAWERLLVYEQAGLGIRAKGDTMGFSDGVTLR